MYDIEGLKVKVINLAELSAGSEIWGADRLTTIEKELSMAGISGAKRTKEASMINLRNKKYRRF